MCVTVTFEKKICFFFLNKDFYFSVNHKLYGASGNILFELKEQQCKLFISIIHKVPVVNSIGLLAVPQQV